MKMSSIFHIFIIWLVTSSLLINTLALAASEKYEAELEKYAKLTKVISGGRYGGGEVSIRVGGHGFYENVPDSMGTIGLYVVAIYKNEVLLKYHYNTYFDEGASEGFCRDIEKLPNGTFVVVAAREEPTRHFDKRGQRALYQIGAQKGLIGQEHRTSYLCIGVKGLARGKAIEKVGRGKLSHIGTECDKFIKFTFPEKPKPKVILKPGKIQRMMIGQTEVLYYIPKYFDPNTAEYLFCIHGAGGSGGAWTKIDEFRVISDIKNFVLIAPRFDGIYNATLAEMEQKEREKDKFDFPLLKDFYLVKYQQLLNPRNMHRSDLKLIEIFNVFNELLIKRERFHLDGHSGGGQFVARFAIFHPELLNKVIASSAGTYAFPDRDKDYPYGLNMDNLEKNFGGHINPTGIRLSPEEIDQKLNKMLDLDMTIIVGELDKTSGPSWQGKDTTEKGHNFYLAMLEEDKKLKEKGVRPFNKECKLKYHMMKGIGHDAHAAAAKAIELAFPITEKKTKGQVLHIDFNKNYRDKSKHKNRITSRKPPGIRDGRAIF
ncbi:MAG: interleukin-like EMT inducer domain-containing protein, partial [Planctomycetota bacterium]